jgi:3-(3-hydroxy-phenyl)propionate hydroxylase
MRPGSSHFPVIIVGAGPTGLTLANLLARYGLAHLLVERNLSTVQEPRAVSIDDESLRTMQAAGVIDSLLTDIVPGYGSIYYTSRRVPFAKVEPTDTPYGYPRRNAFRQPILEGQLRAALGNSTCATQLFGWRLTKFQQTSDGVEALLQSSEGGLREVSCDYLIGCDGAGSTIRTLLDIPLEGTTYMRRWLILDLENHENRTKHTEVFCDPRRPCITLPGPSRTRRFEFEMLPDETDQQMLAPERIGELLAAHGADPEANVCRKVVYRFHARVATRWSVGRVLLAGDAAHLSPPFAGQGMNSGVRDAHNLAWKVVAVATRALGPGLLHTYQQERRDHVLQMIRLALRMGHVMSPPNRCLAMLTQIGFRVLNFSPSTRDYIAQMKYKPKPWFSGGFLVPNHRSARRSLVGRLLAQPTVVMANGQRTLLDEALGLGFALVVRTADPHRAFAALNQSLWDRFAVRRVAVLPQSHTPTQLSGGMCVAECDDSFAISLGRNSASAVLVRPDRYVAACFSLEDATTAAHAAEELLRQTWEGKDFPPPERPAIPAYQD